MPLSIWAAILCLVLQFHIANSQEDCSQAPTPELKDLCEQLRTWDEGARDTPPVNFTINFTVPPEPPELVPITLTTLPTTTTTATTTTTTIAKTTTTAKIKEEPPTVTKGEKKRPNLEELFSQLSKVQKTENGKIEPFALLASKVYEELLSKGYVFQAHRFRRVILAKILETEDFLLEKEKEKFYRSFDSTSLIDSLIK